MKVIHEGLAGDEQFRRRFAREVSAAQRITGPRVAEVIAADPTAARPWMATTYVKGKNLQQVMANTGDEELDYHALPGAEVMSLAAGVGEALVQIHAAGVTHRDLKPTNILIGPGGPKVIDFGIARAIEMSTVTVLGEITGSAGFMSPEQMQGLDVGPPSDMFSLGSVLYFAATGTYAFGAGPAALYRIVHDDPDLSEVVDTQLSTIIAGCLHKDPAQRLTAPDLLRLTGAAAEAGGPITSAPGVGSPSDAPQWPVDGVQRSSEMAPGAKNPSARRRAGVAVVAALVLLLGAGTFFSVRQLSGHGGTGSGAAGVPGLPADATATSILEPAPQSTSSASEGSASPSTSHPTARATTKPRPASATTASTRTQSAPTEEPRETMSPSSTPPSDYSSTGLSMPGDPTAKAYFGRLDSVASAIDGVTLSNTRSYRQAHDDLCVLTVVVQDVEGAEATVYASGFSVADWRGAENIPSSDPSTDDGTVHQQLISPPKGTRSGGGWTGSALLRIDGADTYSGRYTLTHQSGGDDDGLWDFNGETVRCSVY